MKTIHVLTLFVFALVLAFNGAYAQNYKKQFPIQVDSSGVMKDGEGATFATISKDSIIKNHKGEKIAFVGRNGEGKTTLTRIITGEIEYDGFLKLGHNVEFGYYAQNQSDLLNPEKTVFESMKYQQIPAGELAVRRGAHIEATDGYVGNVDEFVVNPANDCITHLVMREGHLWGKKDVIIPLSALDEKHKVSARDSLFLKINKLEVESLPTFPLHRHWD